MTDLDRRIENWKKNLLDLGKRNRLLNYRDAKRSNINIIIPEIETIYSTLVLDEKELKFPFSYHYDEDDNVENKENIIEGDISTNRTIEEQQKTLKNLRSRARTAIEEKGVNILYLVFGFLNWTETAGSKWNLLSPLVLVPVTLTIESLTSPYVLKLHEDEIVVNPTLSYKLENDFGIIFPEFDPYEDNIIEYLNEIKNIIKINGWTVESECGLSLFSFLKMNMYFDLDNNREKIVNNPILKALAGDTSEVQHVPEEYNNYDHDKNEKPLDICQVVDADSSQQDAILYSKKGISFVLQGPPGTGKSQTITNIIAEALADGKKVLFVSEKMAALEVVHKRLTQSGLSDFCLMLHSYKVNKKEVLSELNKTLKLDRIRLQEDALYQLNILEKKRALLNQYVNEIHTTLQPLNKSIYEITGRLAKLSNAPNALFDINGIEDIIREEFYEILYLLEAYAKTVGIMSISYKDNPWRGVQLDTVSHTDRQNIEKNIQDILYMMKEISTYISLLIKEQQVGMPITMNNVKQIRDIYRKIAICPGVPTEWLLYEDIKPLLKKAEEYNQFKNTYKQDYNYITSEYSEDIIKLDGTNIRNCIDTTWQEIIKYLLDKDKDKYIDSRRDKINCFSTISDELKSLIEDISYLNLLGLDIIESFSSIKEMLPILNFLSIEMYPTEEWFDTKTMIRGIELIADFERRYEEIKLISASVLQEYDEEVLNIDYSNMLKRFKTDYTSFTKIFNKEYKADKKIIQGLSNTIRKKISDDIVIDLLNHLKQLEDNKMWIDENEETIQKFLGNQYMGDSTDWGRIVTTINNFKMLKKHLGNISEKVQQSILTSQIDITKIFSIKVRFEKVLSEQQEETIHELLGGNIKSLSAINDILVLLIDETRKIDHIIEEINLYSKKQNKYDAISKLVEKLISVQAIKVTIMENEDSLKKLFVTEYRGIETDWEKVKKQLNWVVEYKNVVNDIVLTDNFISASCEDSDFQNKCVSIANKIDIMLLQMDERWKWLCQLFDERQQFNHQNVDTLVERMQKCVNNMYSLEEWIDFCVARSKCDSAGLGNFIDECNKVGVLASELKDAYLKRFYRSWLDIMIPKYPAVNSFRRRNHESLIEEFSELDLLQMKIARIRIREQLIQKLPDIDRTISARDEVAILRRELNKKSRIMPLRKLFRTIPNLLMTLKPCLMMSPLSVSLFLQADSYDFDIIVFDEASQIHTEDAIGAIMRGKQVVIAGDTKQLPPTSFFVATTSGSDFDSDSDSVEDEDDTNAYESILDEASMILPDRTLKWHYRSKNESLIAFSNAKIYNHDLITFPSPTEGDLDSGVEYVFVENGVYDRGGKKINVIEAEKAVELVFKHIRTTPGRSLGVITFSEAQQYAIETALRSKRIKNPQYEDFFNEDNVDAFFVKNLENVQGDERDSIIFSIGYAKDSNGVMYMNFGPLSRDGGYRRLNVAITRAKYNIKLVGSIRPTDIILENINSEGVKMLRSYIEFAMHGQKVLDTELNISESVNVESPFEEAVYDYLIKHGYKVSTQVGCSGYRIDMAVKHPSLSGRFVLGVECDGATYHSSRTARERDRLRQTILEDIGWKIYRIWSTDWIKDPITEGKRLLDIVNIAIDTYIEDDITLPKTENVEKNEDNDIYEISVEKIQIESDNKINSEFEEYIEANICSIERDYNDNIYLLNVLNHVVSVEAPIHFELLCKRVAPLFGNQKATVKVRTGVEHVLMHSENNILIKGDFCWDKNNIDVKVRKSSDTVSRQIKYIAIEEIIEAMKCVTNNSFGIQKNDLFVAVARIFGFSRTGGNIQVTLSEAFDKMLVDGIISIVDGKIAIIE